jgi:hypothetical protein
MCFHPRQLRNGIPRVLFVFLFYGTEFRVVFSSAEWFGTELWEFASIFVSWYRIPSIFLLCGMVQNGIPRVFCSSEQPEFFGNKPIVPSIPSSGEYFFWRKLQTLHLTHTQREPSKDNRTDQNVNVTDQVVNLSVSLSPGSHLRIEASWIWKIGTVKINVDCWNTYSTALFLISYIAADNGELSSLFKLLYSTVHNLDIVDMIHRKKRFNLVWHFFLHLTSVPWWLFFYFTLLN